MMQKPGIPESQNDVIAQHIGIIHLAFGLDSVDEVNKKAEQFKSAGFDILRGPRITGDNYYEFEILDIDRNRLEITKHDVGDQ